MAKYSSVLKIKVVEEYLSGMVSYSHLQDKYSIPSNSVINEWVNTYQQYGEDGLLSRMTKTKYSGEFKLGVIKYRQIHRLSYQETAHQFEIANSSTIANWVRAYNLEGFEGLDRPIGRSKKMPNNNNNNSNNVPPKKLDETESEELVRLREENELLRMQYEYEKKLRALVLSRDLKTKRKRK